MVHSSPSVIAVLRLFIMTHIQLSSSYRISTFVVHRIKALSHKISTDLRTTNHYSSLSPQENTDSNEKSILENVVKENNESNQKAMKISLSRAGGRSRYAAERRSTNGLSQYDGLFLRTKQIVKRLVPFLVLLLLTRFIFSFFFAKPDSSPSFVYYQKTVYESSSYNSASGKVERTRKESFRSNIPSMISGQKLNKGDSSEDGKQISSLILEQYPDEAFDRDLVQFFPRSILDDFF